ncbi:outer membrane beta-barrel protein [Leptobacterium flavescens]|uniref:Outer membrane beta-barrel protein n=1 Tax=Leptobacterium flavescens TaxID=472055 RepID=A0A6P0UMU9_9FLAO|nr:outer membrane beta-barrel protein [Leptobacterium flavescens]NER13198.1 outer membrane beta-barrel protein [Leptobacterium flavescens]
MSDRKNIDRLFQEKFKDFDPEPGNDVWGKIEGRLDSQGRKTRKVIPIWWKLGGIAAALALIFTIGYNSLNNSDKLPVQENQEVTDTDTNINEIKEINGSQSDQIINSSEGVDNSDVLTNETNSSQDVPTEKGAEKAEKIKTGSGIAIQNPSERNDQQNNAADKAIYTKGDKNKKEAIGDIAALKEKANDKKESDALISKGIAVSKVDKSAEKTELKNNSDPIDKKRVEDVLKETEKDKEAVASNKEKEKKSIYEAIEEQKELEEKIEKARNKWSVSPNVAPVFYSSLGSGSPIHSQFNDNSKSGNVNLSYGVNVAYEVNDRLSIRSGINKVNYGYNTDGVALTSSANELQAIENISFKSDAANLALNDRNSRNPQQQAFSDASALITTPSVDGILTQELGYIEIPLEVKYRVVDKKLGVNIIGGVSSLFLTDNAIFVESQDFVTEIGEANNLNNTNFSTNIGVGVDYKISDKIKVNVEPVFKYQLNTFSGGNGGFKPYSLGVYTGLSLRF